MVREKLSSRGIEERSCAAKVLGHFLKNIKYRDLVVHIAKALSGRSWALMISDL